MLGNKGNGKQFYRNGGTRGGQNQFKWDDVKVDKYRESYLGNSVLAPTGRWQNGKDLTWYAKANGNHADRKRSFEEEREVMRQNDADLINEALGLRPVKKRVTESLDSVDLKHLLSRGGTEREELSIDRVKGLGAAPAKVHEHIERISCIEKEIRKLKSLPSDPGSNTVSKIENAPIIFNGSSFGQSISIELTQTAKNLDPEIRGKDNKKRKKEHKHEKKHHKKSSHKIREK